MYLSRLLLNPYSRQVKREISDPYNLHRTILRAFGSDRKAANVLHRLEINPGGFSGHSGQMMLLVQSETAPDWGWLQAKEYLLPADPFSGLDNPAIKAVELALQNGRFLQFRLRANPTIKKVRRDANGNRLNSNRVPLVHEDKQCEWLNKQAAKSGFTIIDAIIKPEGKQTGYHKKLTIYTVLINGRLQITDTTKFSTALRQGIGPAKAFGCGLLSIAPG